MNSFTALTNLLQIPKCSVIKEQGGTVTKIHLFFHRTYRALFILRVACPTDLNFWLPKLRRDKMALLSAMNRMFRTRPALVFVAGVAVGILCSVLFRTTIFVRFPTTEAPRRIGSLRARGVSHNPEVLKRVLAARGDIPHIAQVRFHSR